jgi:hypothetical protein
MTRKSTAPSRDENRVAATRAKPQRRTAAKTRTRDVETLADVDAVVADDRAARDPIDADERHRLISEAAHALYAGRGYVNGFDFEDWLTAEAQVDNALLNRGGAKKRS